MTPCEYIRPYSSWEERYGCLDYCSCSGGVEISEPITVLPEVEPIHFNDLRAYVHGVSLTPDERSLICGPAFDQFAEDQKFAAEIINGSVPFASYVEREGILESHNYLKWILQATIEFGKDSVCVTWEDGSSDKWEYVRDISYFLVRALYSCRNYYRVIAMYLYCDLRCTGNGVVSRKSVTLFSDTVFNEQLQGKLFEVDELDEEFLGPALGELQYVKDGREEDCFLECVELFYENKLQPEFMRVAEEAFEFMIESFGVGVSDCDCEEVVSIVGGNDFEIINKLSPILEENREGIGVVIDVPVMRTRTGVLTLMHLFKKQSFMLSFKAVCVARPVMRLYLTVTKENLTIARLVKIWRLWFKARMRALRSGMSFMMKSIYPP